MEITKEQIKELSQINSQTAFWCKKNYPQAFEIELEAGKWYKWDQYSNFLFFFEGEYGNSYETNKNYGFDINGEWIQSSGISKDRNYTEATEAEVFEALTKEAVKRGFIGNQYIDISNLGFKNDELITGGQLEFKEGWLNFGDKKTAIFKDGVWGSVVTSITKEEAEQKLNCKII